MAKIELKRISKETKLLKSKIIIEGDEYGDYKGKIKSLKIYSYILYCNETTATNKVKYLKKYLNHQKLLYWDKCILHMVDKINLREVDEKGNFTLFKVTIILSLEDVLKTMESVETTNLFEVYHFKHPVEIFVNER